MSVKSLSDSFRTWIEIDKKAAQRNLATFRKLLSPKTRLWAVVKSNAYGHGLFLFAKLAERLGVDGFCVDTIVEGIALRREGVRKPILVLGFTLPKFLGEAYAKNLTLTVSSFGALKSLQAHRNCPAFHVKIDSGMHRQGFFLADVPRVVKLIKARTNLAAGLKGIYTHFSSAKDVGYPTYTERQFAVFEKATRLLERGGLKNLARHCAATGGTLLDKKYHLDAARVGIGLYGLYPSFELETQLRRPAINLKPILSWRTIVTEVKHIPAGSFVGYDLTERVNRPTKAAVLPIGYWHGFPRALSSKGEVLINGRRTKVLGRVSMDLTVVDATGLKIQPGDIATLIGREKSGEIAAHDIAEKCGTSQYEIVTRINPLIERVLV